MSVSGIFVHPHFVMWLISDGFVRQSKRALKQQGNVKGLFMCFVSAMSMT